MKVLQVVVGVVQGEVHVAHVLHEHGQGHETHQIGQDEF
jgi:hypothetical protein